MMPQNQSTVYDGICRVIDAWDSINPQEFRDLEHAWYGRDIKGIRGSANYTGRSTGLSLQYRLQGRLVFSVTVPQFACDEAAIFLPDEDSKEGGPMKRTSIGSSLSALRRDLEMYKRGLEEKAASYENPTFSIVHEAA
jgi:hypothetical protein